MMIDRQLLATSWHSWISNDNRQRAGPYWLQWLWTLLFCAMLAVPFTVLGFFAFASGEGAWRNGAGWLHWYGKNFTVCLTIGATIQLLFDLARHWLATPDRLRRWSPWQRTLFFSGTSMIGVAIGWPIGAHLAGDDVTVWIGHRDGNNLLLGTVLVSLMISVLIHRFFAARARQLEADKRATEARLRLLQAQIEPHFLFNTLANVASLIEHDPPAARQMLEAFTDYLRSSLTTLRHDASPLGQELELAERYLQLLQVRMADRLHFSIEADAAARAVVIPPLLLQPLIENAIQHGLEPKVDGGTVRVLAHVRGDRLEVEVVDDGLGLEAPARRGKRPGTGLALSNIRQRLLACYGTDAQLDVSRLATGTRATLNLPLDSGSGVPA